MNLVEEFLSENKNKKLGINSGYLSTKKKDKYLTYIQYFYFI